MTINNIWVFAQANGDVPTTGTLELLAKARSIGASVTAFVGGDATAIAGALGEHGATRCMQLATWLANCRALRFRVQ